MKVPKYNVFERVGGRTERVTSFRELEKHHPSKGREPGRDYDVIDGELEEVRRMPDGRILIKKDFFLTHATSSKAPIYIPAPVAGYTWRLGDKTNALRIYSKPYWEPGNRLLAQSLHMRDLPPNGTFVKRGESIGVMSDVGSPGSIHAHLEMTRDDWQNYIIDIISGEWPDE